MRVDWREIKGLALHDAAVHQDSRGDFVKLWDDGSGHLSIRQLCTAHNHRSGTVRGMHFQVPPRSERKLVWCTAGEIWDVVVDTRESEPTYGAWAAVPLRAGRPQILDVPAGLAHGYQTMVDATTVTYLIDGTYSPTHGRTLAWDDPSVGITWPSDVTEISASDRNGLAWPPS